MRGRFGGALSNSAWTSALAVAVLILSGSPALAQQSTLSVRIMPDQPTYPGRQLKLWAEVRDTNTISHEVFFTWDFGDGSTPVTGRLSAPPSGVTVSNHPFDSNAKVISVIHQYMSDEFGRTYVASLTVDDSVTNERASAAAGITMKDAGLLQTRVEVMIHEQLKWLYDNRKSAGVDGLTGKLMLGLASDGSTITDYDTGLALLAFCNNGYTPKANKARHPYVDFAEGMLNYLLVQLRGGSNHDPASFGGYDANGNRLGYYYANNTYQFGILSMALIGTLEPNRDVTAFGMPGANKTPWTLRDVVQDCVDGFATAQSNSNGWHYRFRQGDADGSTNQWPVIVLYEATLPENGFNCVIPGDTLSRQTAWLNSSQSQHGDHRHGGFDYTVGSGWWTIGKAGGGLVAQKVIGRSLSDQRVQDTIGFIQRNWNSSYTSAHTAGWHTFNEMYEIFSLAKGLRVWGVEVLNVGGQQIKWYDVLASRLVDSLMGEGSTHGFRGDGTWPKSVDYSDGGSGHMNAYRMLRIAGSILTLSQSVVGVPPIADASGGATQDGRRVVLPSFQAFTLDASKSSTPDPNRSVVTYEWDLTGTAGFPSESDHEYTPAEVESTVFSPDLEGEFITKTTKVKTSSPQIRVIYGGNPRDVVVKLRVWDNGTPRLSDTDQITVEIRQQNVPPNVAIVSFTPKPVHIFDTVVFDIGRYDSNPTLAGTYDPNYESGLANYLQLGGDPAAIPDALRQTDYKEIAWDLDGNNAYEYVYTVTTDPTGLRTYAPQAGAPAWPPTAVFESAGRRTVNLRVRDQAAITNPSANPAGFASIEFDVVNEAPAAGFIDGPDVVFGTDNGAEVPVVASGFSDPEGRPLRYRWSWAGGNKISDEGEGGAAAPDSRTTLGSGDDPSDPNDHPVLLGIDPDNIRIIRVVADDGSGGLSTEVSKPIRVIKNKPTASIYGRSVVRVGVEHTWFDRSVLLGGNTVKTRQWTVDGVNRGTGSSLAFTFSTTGNHTIALTIVDTTDSVSTVSKTVNVRTDPPQNVNPPALGQASISGQTLEDAPIPLDLKVTDADGDELTYTFTATTQGGALGSFSGDGDAVLYTPGANKYGTDTFTFTASDGVNTSAMGTITITITPVPDAPVVSAGATVTTPEEMAIQIDLGPRTVDPDDAGGPSTVASWTIQGTSGGTASLQGSIATFTPAPNFNGTASLTFRATDTSQRTGNTASISITVTPVNDPPLAADSPATVLEDTPSAIPLPGTDVDTAPAGLSFRIVDPPAHGSIAIAGGNATYTPAKDFFGDDTFTYQVNDSEFDSPRTGRITVKVNPVNDAPTVSLPATIDVIDGDPIDTDSRLRFVQLAFDSQSADVDHALGALTYTWTVDGVVRPEFNNQRSITWTFTDADHVVSATHIVKVKAADGILTSTEATVSVNITYNTPPTWAEATPLVVFNEDETASLDLHTVISDRESPDGDLTLTIDTGNSTLLLGPSIADNRTLVFSPRANFHGTGTLTLVATDPRPPFYVSKRAYQVVVNSVNDLPVATNVTPSVAEDGVLTGTLAATDLESSALTFAIVAGPSHGGLQLLDPAAGTYQYTPAGNYFGPDSFTFQATDPDDGTSNVATALITVSAVNDAPVATAGGTTMQEDGELTGTLSGSDIDSAVLSFTIAQGPANGTVFISNSFTGAFVYRPKANHFGTDSFTFRVSDGTASSGTATFTITINGVNDAPVASAANLVTPEDTPLVGNLIANDADPDDSLTFIPMDEPTHGDLTVVPETGAFTYAPDPGYSGPDSFSFRVTDGTVDSGEATVTLFVSAVNDPPTALPLQATIDEDGSFPGVLAGSDPDSASLRYAIVTAPANGTVTLDAESGAFTYRPNANYVGGDSFTYKASDGVLDSGPATVSITIEAENDAPVATGAALSATEDQLATGTLTATDVDSTTLTFSIASQPAHGHVTLIDAATGAYEYTPNADFAGSDAFTFRASDGSLTSSPATISVTVAQVNDAPVAVIAGNDSVDANAAGGATVTLDGTASFDLEGAVTYAWTGPFGSATGSRPSVFLPLGASQVTLEVTDGSGAKGQTTRTLTVVPERNLSSAVVSIVSGNGQSATVGTALSAPLRARATDRFGNPHGAVNLRFTPVAGGSVSPDSAMTNASGEAATTFTLGTVAGAQRVRATIIGATGPLATFVATAEAERDLATAAISKAGGDQQSAPVGSTLQPITARVVDRFGNPIPSLDVAFEALDGGSIAPAIVQTDAAGLAAATPTLGSVAQLERFRAALAGLPASAVTFEATATPDTNLFRARIAKAAGDAKSGTVGQPLAEKLAVIVTDQDGNPLAGVTVTFRALSGGSVSPASPVTNAGGRAETTATLGTRTGAQTFRAEIAANTSVFTTFSETALAETSVDSAVLAIVAGDGQVGTVGKELASALRVRVADRFGNPVPGMSIRFTPQGGGSIEAASAATDEAGEAATAATLGTAAGQQIFVAALLRGDGSPAKTTTFRAAAEADKATATIASLAGNGQTGVAGKALAQAIGATIRDEHQNPVPGMTVRFGAPAGGGTGAATVVTDGAGNALTTATLGTAAGAQTFTLELLDAGGGVQDADTIAATAGPDKGSARVASKTGDGQTGTVGAALGAAIGVVVQDAHGNPIPGLNVRFVAEAVGGSVGASPVATDAAGAASTTATLGRTAGSQTFRAEVLDATGTVLATATLTHTARADAATARIARKSGDGQTGIVGKTLAAALVAHVEDGFANPVPGMTVRFRTTAGAVGAQFDVTDDAGAAQTSATLGTVAGPQQFFADLENASGALIETATFTIAAKGDPAGARIARKIGDAQVGTVGKALASAIGIRVDDQHGNGVEGMTVRFSSQSGGSVGSATATTGASGSATTGATLGGEAGPQIFLAELLAADGGVIATETIAATASADPATATIAALIGEGRTGTVGQSIGEIGAVVEDGFGNPVAGMTVRFSSLSGSVANATVVTDAAGEAKTTATLGVQSGSQTFKIELLGGGGAAIDTRTLTATAEPDPEAGAATIAIASGNGQTGTAGRALVNPLVARVSDGFGNGVAGILVNWRAPDGGSIVASSTTGATGLASATPTLGQLLGTYRFVAEIADNPSATVEFTTTARAGPPARLGFDVAPPASAKAGKPFGFVARIEDEFGNLVTTGVQAVTAAVAPGASRALAGTKTATASGGLAAFTALRYDAQETIRIVITASGLAPATSDEIAMVGSEERIEFLGFDGALIVAPPGTVHLGIEDSEFGSSTFVRATMALASGPDDAIPLRYDGGLEAPAEFRVLREAGVDVTALTAGDYVFAWDVQLANIDPRVYTTPDGRLTRTLTLRILDLPPEPLVIVPQIVRPGEVGFLDGTGSRDPNGMPITFEWSLQPPASPAVAGMVLAAASAAVTIIDADKPRATFVTDPAFEGLLTFYLTVRDATTAQSTVIPGTSLVSSTERVPIASAGRSRTVLVGTGTVLDGTGSIDADGDELTYAWVVRDSSGVEAPQTLDDATAARPTFIAHAVGIFDVELRVEDPDGHVSEPSRIRASVVSADGGAPPDARAVVIAPAAGMAAGVGDLVTLDGSESTGRTPIRRYRWRQSAGLDLHLGVVEGKTLDLRAAQPGTYAFDLIVTDAEGLEGIDTVEFQVRAVAGPAFEIDARAVSGLDANGRAQVGTPVGLRADVEEAGGGAAPAGVVFAWRQVEGPIVVLEDGGEQETSFTPEHPGFALFEVVAYVPEPIVGSGATAWLRLADTVRVVADAPGFRAPTVVARLSAPRRTGGDGVLDLSKSLDPENNIVRFEIEQIESYPPVAIVEDPPGSGKFRFVAPAPGTYRFLVYAIDGTGLRSEPFEVVFTVAAGESGGGGGKGGVGGGGGCAAGGEGAPGSLAPVLALVAILGLKRRRAGAR